MASDRDLPETVTAPPEGAEAREGRKLDRPEAPDVRPGDCLGRYTVRALVGAGGMGRVYAAFDPELGRQVALKLIRADRSVTARARARLLREAQAMARLHHPNVVTVHDVGTQGDQVFIAMEFVEGPTLAHWLTTGKRGWREVLSHFLAAGRGLTAAHDAGIVHRDFKPENVIVARDRVVVVDFGLARAGGDDDETDEPAADSGAQLAVDLTLTGERVGTPLYMSPEQRLGDGVTAKSDQYSFCVALWKALHGERPSTLAGAHRRPDVPGWVNAALSRGLQLDPEQRWPSMQALLDALGRDPARTRRRVASAAAVVVLAVISAVAVARSRASDPCAGAGARLSGVWDAARKQAVHDAFAHSGVDYAEEAWQRASARIDDYASGWTNMYTEACRATRVEGRQSDTLLDLRMDCLERRRAVLGALSELWSRGMDRKAVEAAAQAAAGLAPLGECADVRALTDRAPLPKDPAVAARIETARKHLDQVVALNLAHRWTEARAAAPTVRAEADATGFALVRAEAALAEGISLYELRDPRAEPLLLDAARLAGAARDDRLAARALIELVEDLSLNEDTAGRALLVADIADGVIARVGDDPALRAQNLHNRGETLLSEGKYEEAGAAFRAAEPYFAAAYGKQDAETLANRGQLVRVFEGQGRYAEARKLGEENLAATVAAVGDKHPYVGVVLNNLALAVLEGGDPEAAVRYCRQAVDIEEIVAGPDSERTANVYDNLGVALLGMGRLDEAEQRMERADAIHRRVLGEGHPLLAEARIDFAAARRKRGRFDEAQKMLEDAVTILTRAYGPRYDGLAHAFAGLGRVREARGDAAGALEHYRRALELGKEALGPEHPRTLAAMNQVARLLARLHRCAEAQPLAAAATVGLERAVGPEHPDFAAALAAGCTPKASDLERAVGILERARVAPVDRGAVRFALARALWEAGRREAALAAAKQAAEELAGDADGARDRAAAQAWLAQRRL